GRTTKAPQQSLSRVDAWLTTKQYNAKVIGKKTQESIYLKARSNAAAAIGWSIDKLTPEQRDRVDMAAMTALAHQVTQAAIAHGDIKLCEGKPPKVEELAGGPYLHDFLKFFVKLDPGERGKLITQMLEKVHAIPPRRRMDYFDTERDRIR